MLRRTFFISGAAALAACSGPSTLLDIAPVQSDLQLRALVGSVMLRTVSLPSYAAAEQVAVQTAEGFISSSDDILWADEPERAVTLVMTRHLNTILGATVGPDPWPFAGLPDVAVDVRVERMLAGADGIFRLSGQYFIGGDGIDFPNRASSFAITTPLVGEGTSAISAAQAAALLQLSEEIARRLAR